MTLSQLKESVANGQFDHALNCLYTTGHQKDALPQAKGRVLKIMHAFSDCFPSNDGCACLFSSPGRTELGGNHTDHQHGRVLCASVNLDMLCCAAPNDSNLVHIVSEGYPPIKLDLSLLTVQEHEKNTSHALVRGVAARIKQLGFTPMGFDAYLSSDVLSGSGLSSSAAYEVLIGTIINHFFCNSALSALEIAKIGQYAETVFFGKPSGLMDQCGCAIGGAVFIDFKNPQSPVVSPVAFDFTQSGYTLCIVDTKSGHADLTDDYAAITQEMAAVSAHFGVQWLRDVSYSDFLDAMPAIRTKTGDRALLRALHFFEEDVRAQSQMKALEKGNFDEFLRLVKLSARSSALHLQNLWSPNAPEKQAVGLAIAVGETVLKEKGAIRVHGGGFGGTIQAFVPNDLVDAFSCAVESLLGKGACHRLCIRPQGGTAILPHENQE